MIKSLFYYLRTLLRKTKKTFINFYHWSNYEKSIFNKYKDDMDLCLKDNYKFNDLCEQFKNSVVIKDVFNFKLKSIGNALYKYGLIQTNYNSDCTNGLDASISACKLYNEGYKYNKVMKDIENYNEIDCKLVYELHKLLISH